MVTGQTPASTNFPKNRQISGPSELIQMIQWCQKFWNRALELAQESPSSRRRTHGRITTRTRLASRSKFSIGCSREAASELSWSDAMNNLINARRMRLIVLAHAIPQTFQTLKRRLRIFNRWKQTIANNFPSESRRTCSWTQGSSSSSTRRSGVLTAAQPPPLQIYETKVTLLPRQRHLATLQFTIYTYNKIFSLCFSVYNQMDLK